MEDTQIMEKMNKFAKSIEGTVLTEIMQFTQHKFEEIQETCFQANKANVNRYADCFYEKKKDTERDIKKLDFKFLFL